MWIACLNAISENLDTSKLRLKWKRKKNQYTITFSNLKWHLKPPSDNTNMETKLIEALRALATMAISHNKSSRDRVVKEYMSFSVSFAIVHKI